MSRLLPDSAPVIRLERRVERRRLVHVSLEPFVFDIDDWCDYLCAGCGRGGEGKPWRTVLGGERPAKFHGPGCLAKWAGDSMQALPDRPPSL